MRRFHLIDIDDDAEPSTADRLNAIVENMEAASGKEMHLVGVCVYGASALYGDRAQYGDHGDQGTRFVFRELDAKIGSRTTKP